MALLRVLRFPDPYLKNKATKVTEFPPEFKTLVADMAETMYAESGIGLAATQVGRPESMFLMDTGYETEDMDSRSPEPIFNPVICDPKGSTFIEEGCLSVPDYKADVRRYASLTLKYQDIEGNHKELEAQGLRAICIQHEMDHLEGILFIDRLPSLKRNMIKKKLKKQAARDAN